MARVGQKLKLECVVSGQPNLRLIWKQNNRPVFNPEAQIQFDGQQGSLILPEALLKDAGEYTVTVQNESGSTSSTCNVSVKGRIPNETSDSEFASDIEPIKPSVQMPLRNTSVDETKSIRLDCIIVGQPEPEVIWYHNGRPVKESADVRLLFHGDRCSLLIQEALVEDSGEYKVVAINSAGETSSQCYLTVVKPKPVREEPQTAEPMHFTRLLSDVLASEGERIELECAVVGKPQITWLFNNKPIVPEPRLQIVDDGQGNHKLVIHKVEQPDRGLYTVKATNPSGDIKCFSHVIVKAVNVAEGYGEKPEPEEENRFICPTFKELFSDKLVTEGSGTKFECIVIGKPVPKVKWMFNDQPVYGKEFLVSTSGERQVLSIPEVTRSVTGKVACIAENEIGKATCVAYLNLIQPNGNGHFEETGPETQSFTQEHNIQSSRVTITKQSYTTTQHQHVDSVDNQVSQMQIYSHDIPLTIQSNDHTQVQEYRQQDDGQSNVQEKSVINVIRPVLVEPIKSARKSIAPRFVTPLTGKIVDQLSDVMLEGIVDGYPTPSINVFKNGLPLTESYNCGIHFEHNKVTITLLRVGIDAAGRYSCVASNDAGTSTSVADVVVKS